MLLVDDLFDAPGRGELGGVFFEVECDGRAAFLAGGRTDDEGVVAVAFPLGGFGLGVVGATDDGDFVGHDERGVEPDAKLADEIAGLSGLE